MASRPKRFIIRGRNAGTGSFEVIEPGEDSGVNGLIRSGKPIATFEVAFDKDKGVYTVKNVSFDERLSRRERDLIMALILEFVSSLNQ